MVRLEVVQLHERAVPSCDGVASIPCRPDFAGLFVAFSSPHSTIAFVMDYRRSPRLRSSSRGSLSASKIGFPLASSPLQPGIGSSLLFLQPPPGPSLLRSSTVKGLSLAPPLRPASLPMTPRRKTAGS
eukprot:3192480-Rhodomonas_salina.2